MGELRRLCYQTKGRKPFKRYMWRWDGIWSGTVFQMSRITVGNIERPYTYINAYCSQGSNASNNQLPENMLKSDSLLSTYDKWCRVSINTSAYGWIIFDIGSSEAIDSYTLMTGGDTATNTGRNPKRVRLYGTNVETSSGDDSSWELLSDENVGLPAANHANWTTSTKVFVTSTSYLLAPSDISRGTGMRWETPDYTVLYSRADQFSSGTYPGGTIPWSEHNVILFKFNGWATGSNDRLSLAVNPPNDTWRVGIRRNDSKFGSGYFAVEKGGWFSGVTIDDSSVVASSAWGGGVIFYTIPATTSSNTNEFRIIVDRVNNTVYFYLNGVLKFHQTGFSDYENTMYMFPESNSTFMKDAYIVGCNSLQDALFYGTIE